MSTVAAIPTASSMVYDNVADPTPRFAGEERFVRWLCRLSPLIALVSIPLASLYAVPALYLKPMPEFHLGITAWTWKPAWVLAVALAALPWIWLATLRWERRSLPMTLPLAALLAMGSVIVSGLLLDVPRIRWQLAELVKLRTSNPSFARNTLYWEAREFEAVPASTPPARRIGLVGSSQVYQGLDLQTLATANRHWTVEKNCLAGFGPLQYPWLESRIAERHFDQIVCQLSEFDFFREDEVPANRLRWAASLAGCCELIQTLDFSERWSNRGHLADLAFAALAPWWRWRDHLRRTATGYWWDISAPPPAVSDQDGPSLAEASDLAEGIQHLAANVHRARLVDVNFRNFERFAHHLRQVGIELTVLEGSCHPEGMAAYDAEFREETRERMRNLAAAADFRYLPASELPKLSAHDFADAYHLNRQGKERMTAALIELLRRDPQVP